MIRSAVVELKNLPPLPLVLERQARRRDRVVLPHVRRRRFPRGPGRGLLGRVPRVRRLNRPATHARQATPLRRPQLPQARGRPRPRLILHCETDRVTQPRHRLGGHRVDPVQVRVVVQPEYPDERLPRGQQVRQRGPGDPDRRQKRTPNVVHLVLRRGRDLNQRGRVPRTHRLARVIVETPPASASVVGAVVRVPSLRPPGELGWPDSLAGCPARRLRALPELLHPDDQRPPVDESLVRQRLLTRAPRRVLADPVMVRRAPELPVVLAVWLAPLEPVRDRAVRLIPAVEQVPQSREVHHPDPVGVRHQPSGAADNRRGRASRFGFAACSATSSRATDHPFSRRPAGVNPI